MRLGFSAERLAFLYNALTYFSKPDPIAIGWNEHEAQRNKM